MEKYTSLGLIVNQNSFIQLFEINSDAQLKAYSGEIPEIRNLSANNALLLQKCDGGHVIRIFIPAGGRNDYMSASIFVPCNIEITGRELSEIIVSTKNVLQDWRKDTAGIALTPIYEKKYKARDVQKTFAGVKTGEIAFRKYGDFYQLYEILNDLYQPYYDAYKMIFLLDAASGVVCNGAANLTNNNIAKNLIVNPPAPVDGYTPYLGEAEFTQSVISFVGDTLNLSWRKKGYKNIDKPTAIATPDIILPLPLPTDYKKLISHKNFRVFDKKGARVEDYLIMINGKEVTKGKCIAVSVSALDAVKIKIFPADKTLQTYEATVDLLSKDEEKITLKNVTFEYDLHIHGNETVVLTLQTQKRFDACPIQGYAPINGRFDLGKNILVYKPFNKKMWITLSLAALVLMLLGFAAGWWFGSNSSTPVTNQTELTQSTDDKNTDEPETQTTDDKNTKEPETQTSDDQNTDEPETQTSDDKNTDEPETQTSDDQNTDEPTDDKPKLIQGADEAKKHLDKTRVWAKDKLEQYEELVGLWDALNEYNFEKVQKIQDRIKSNALGEILKKAKNSNKSGKYNNPGDYKITYNTYLDKL